MVIIVTAKGAQQLVSYWSLTSCHPQRVPSRQEGSVKRMVKGSNRNSGDEMAITVMRAFSNADGTRNSDDEMAITVTRAFSKEDVIRKRDDEIAITVMGAFSNADGTKTTTIKWQSQ